MAHNFTRCPEKEHYGIPRFWQSENSTTENSIRCWIEKTTYGRWQLRFRRSEGRNISSVFDRDYRAVEEKAEAIDMGQTLIKAYSQMEWSRIDDTHP